MSRLRAQAETAPENPSMDGVSRQIKLLGFSGEIVEDIVQHVKIDNEREGKEKGGEKYSAEGTDKLRASRIPSRNNLMLGNSTIPSTVFDTLQEVVLERMRKEHFQPFLKSEEYVKFLQFKALGEKKYGEPDFAVFRKLGRGGEPVQ